MKLSASFGQSTHSIQVFEIKEGNNMMSNFVRKITKSVYSTFRGNSLSLTTCRCRGHKLMLHESDC
ncbi:hypothetical protein C1H46_008843 [Malus baccata]|uniref:Uncharacterized protein n=1 Tax=Malus baccata TaxID=106549 RepID=A0A540N3F8_MALBA|nr:hypothetical protein C1H46_008843 [Malus baccata]